MGTRSQAFTAKIKNLQELQSRLISGSFPPPQGHEVANSLKYFTTTLLSVLKDVPGQPLLMMRDQTNDVERLALYPSLDYKGLYNTLIQFQDIFPVISNSLYDFGKAYFCTLCSLVPFLERNDLETLPYFVAATLISLPVSLHEDVLDVLCWHLLPFTMNTLPQQNTENCPATENDAKPDSNGLGLQQTGNYASNSAAAILMMVFQYVKDNSALHRKITECLMDHKCDLAKDLLCVIAHGTPNARSPAATLLFYYWPTLNPTSYDRRNMLNKLNSGETWKPPKCFHPECQGSDATKVCFDHTISLAHHPDRPPPSFYCSDCYEKMKKLSPNSSHLFEDINHPIEQSDTTCENKNCRSQSDKTAVALCFSRECTSYNGNKPVRLCNTCNNIRHNTRRGSDHVVHITIPSPWEMDSEPQSYFVKAVIGLLQEAVPYGSGRKSAQGETHRRTMQVLTNSDDEDDGLEDEASLNERRLLSRYGIWLLSGLGTPKPPFSDTPAATFGHMLSMLFQWFNATAYLPNDKTGTSLEKLKSESLPQWLRKVYKSHPDVFVQCVLPNPPDYAKVGGHWEILASRTDHIKEGLVRFFCLVPYDVITLEVWNQAMSHWMEAINQDVPRDELNELKSVFCKIFDPDMSPLGFDARQMYQFISERFVNTTAEVQKQALQWLQKLCLLEIPVPLDVLFEMLNNGAEALIQGEGENLSPLKPIVENRTLGCDDDIWNMISAPLTLGSSGVVLETDCSTEFKQPVPTTREETYLTCFNLIIDVMNGQMELQDIERNIGLKGPYVGEILSLVTKMLTSDWLSEIQKCLNEAGTMDLDDSTEAGVTLVEELLTDFLQMINATIRKIAPIDFDADEDDGQNTTNSGSEAGNPPQGTDSKIMKKPGLSGFMAVLTTMQSTVEKTRDMEETTSESSLDAGDEEFVVKIEDYPVSLQLIYYLLLRNSESKDADMRFYLLDSVRLLAMPCEVLSSSIRKHRKFINWCQESLLTGALWKVLEVSHSQVAQVAVPLLLHAVTLPGGSDVFWKAIDEDFQHEDWRIRFAAVEKITATFRFLDDKPVRRSASLRSVLSHAFCCLIAILNDVNPLVSLRANLNLGTIHDAALKLLIGCLEYQFDSVPIDRSVILKRLYQLFNCLAERKCLSWRFFAARFEMIINEIQSARNGEFYNGSSRQDQQVRMSASHNAAAIASAGVNRRTFRPGDNSTYSLRSLSSNLKYPYKRTISAPAGMGLASRANLTHPLNQLSSSGTDTPSAGNKQSTGTVLRGKGTKDNLSKQPSNVAAVLDDIEHVAANVAARTVDMDEVDKETIHLLVFLFMQFLSNADQAVIPDEKQHHKSQPWQKCFQFLYALLGFNEVERRFTTMPHKIRSAPAVNSFLANLPQVLDTNFEIGKFILVNCVLILQKTPFPPRYATAWQQGYTLMQEKYLFQGCGFSLWHLEPSMRKNWLSSVMVIMYKYNFSDGILSERAIGLIRIVIHTIAAHSHVCNRYSKPTTGFANRSRDLSQLSLGGDTDNQHPDVDDQNVDNDHVGGIDENIDEDFDEEIEDEENLEADGAGGENNEKDAENEGKPLATDGEESIKKMEIEKEKAASVVEVPNLFVLLPRPSSERVGPRLPPTPTDFELTSEGMPDGWAMQLMKSGRTLFIDSRNQVTTWIDPRTGRPSDPIRPESTSLSQYMFESPPSPQSLMDVITVGSPVAVDMSDSTSSSITSPKRRFFEPPPEERLLPIGLTRKNTTSSTGSQGKILDRVWQVFGGLESESIPLVEEKITTEKIQIVANIQKQDSECGKEDEEMTECYVGHITHFRNDSIRRDKVENSNTTTEVAPTTIETKEVPKPEEKTVESIQASKDSAVRSKAAKIEASKLRRRKGISGPGQESQNDIKTIPKNRPPMRQQSQQQSRMDSSGSLFSIRDNPLLLKQSSLRIGEDSIADRCSRCGQIKEEYSEEEIGNCVVILNTFVNRDPAQAAPLLPEILLVVARLARDSQYSWELDSNTYVPSNTRSIAKQFIRCALHQLSGNGIFWMIFHLRFHDEHRQDPSYFVKILNTHDNLHSKKDNSN